MTSEPDRESYYEAAASVWNRGCAGETLSGKEAAQFRSLARNRFYTFQLSIGHARIGGDAAKVQSLIRSLAIDLEAAPGLKAEWLGSEFSEADFGSLVTSMLEA